MKAFFAGVICLYERMIDRYRLVQNYFVTLCMLKECKARVPGHGSHGSGWLWLGFY